MVELKNVVITNITLENYKQLHSCVRDKLYGTHMLCYADVTHYKNMYIRVNCDGECIGWSDMDMLEHHNNNGYSRITANTIIDDDFENVELTW